MKLQEIAPMPRKYDLDKWMDFQAALSKVNRRTLYNSDQPGVQEARSGFFNSLKDYAPNEFNEMQELNTDANNELQGVIAMGMEEYKQDPLSRAALDKAPFDAQIPMGVIGHGLPEVSHGKGFPGGINVQSQDRYYDTNNRIFLNGEATLDSMNRKDYENIEGGYPYELENRVLHEGLHTVLPSTEKTGKGFYSLYGNPEAQARNDVIPDEEFRVRQLTNAYAERLGRPYPDFDKENVWLIDQESADYFDRAVPPTQPLRGPHPTDKGFDFWSSL